MLPKRARLTSAGVERVLKKPFRTKQGLFRCSWRENRAGYPRCAVVVTKGENIGSVQRNRLRRVSYAALEEGLAAKELAADIVVFIRGTNEEVVKETVLPDIVKIVAAVSEAARSLASKTKTD